MRTAGFRSIVVKPKQHFGSIDAAAHQAGIDPPPRSPRLFDAPLVCIVVASDGQPVWEPTLFLADTALSGRGFTGDTVRSYAEAIVGWLEFLHDRGEALAGATEETLGVYRSALSSPSQARGKRLAVATVNHRVTVACQLHLWGQRTSSMPSPLGVQLVAWAKLRDPLARYARVNTSPRRIHAPAPIRRLPTVLTTEELSRIFSVAPMPYRLMFKWALAVGLRRFEICDLQTSQLPDAEALAVSPDGLARIQLNRKGGRSLTAYAPTRLVEETNWYVLTERREASGESQGNVFLNKRGHPVSRCSLSAVFRHCADSISSRATLHHLRHTFAVRVLGALEASNASEEPMNAFKTLQILLGHASIESTEIYLEAMSVSQPAVMEALDYLYGATL